VPPFQSQSSQAPHRPAIVCLSQSFAPDTTPTAIRASKLLEQCSARWEISVLTEARGEHRASHVRVKTVRGWRPSRLLTIFRRLRLAKLLELGVWPDDAIFWVPPAILAGRRLIRELQPSAIVVFMMPYSSGLAGIVLSRLTGLPLILNFDDSPTCTDMHPHFPTRLHYRLAKALEDFYIRSADAVIYVSQTNLESVSSRQPARVRESLHLVRYAADRSVNRSQRAPTQGFEIVYVGAMSGWWSLIEPDTATTRLQRAYEAWTRLGRHERTVLDQRTSSPAVIGAAILDAIAGQPQWAGNLKLRIVGNPYPPELVARALADTGVAEVVEVFGPVAHEDVEEIIAGADLLFLTLPDRLDRSPGGRISAKTYEYLATDRPILAAVPLGENWDYLTGKPGVWLVQPGDRRRMTEAIVELAGAKFTGSPRTFDRSGLQRELSYETRAAEFAEVVELAIEHRRDADQRGPAALAVERNDDPDAGR
jgi:Glycosyl transferases group 1/Glycosyl transferase 4-like domain